MDASAFWSYAHEDDALDDGNIVLLAQRLANEFALLTGTSLRIFVDRTSVEWGDEWRRRIDDALSETTFFIPIVTPRYFTRDECRRELLTFVGQATSLGVTELVLPVVYAPVAGLDAENPDEAIAIIGRTQYVDWTSLRLTGHGSVEYRTALNELAMRLGRVAADVETTISGRERAASDEQARHEEPLALMEVVEQIGALLADWLSAVEQDQVTEAQHDATAKAYAERLRRLRRSGRRGGPEFAVLTSYARDDLPIAKRHEEQAEVYLSRTVALDPLVHTAIRLVEEHPDATSALDPLREAVAEAMRVITGMRQREEEEGRPTMVETAERYSHISSLWRQVGASYLRSTRYVAEANELVETWARDLARLDSASAYAAEPPPPSA